MKIEYENCIIFNMYLLGKKKEEERGAFEPQ